MGIISTILGGGHKIVSEATGAVTAVGNDIDQLVTSDEERAHAKVLLARLYQKPHVLQAEINKIEATHRSLWVAGWRPFIGWVCGVGLMWAFLGHPLFEWGVALTGADIRPPAIVTDHMVELVLALLGLGGLRTVEKLGGRSR